MNQEAQRLLRQYRRVGVMVDTNMLLLYVVGVTDPRVIETFHHTKNYTVDDFEILADFIDNFTRRLTTPHILTEVSNFVGKLPDYLKVTAFDRLAAMTQVYLQEYYVPAEMVANMRAFRLFGLTDVGIAEVVHEQYLVLTDDFPLTAYLQGRGIDVLNFNHLRPYQPI